MIQLTTVSVTPTTIMATGYQGPAATATFCVKNPGSDYSNSITVPVGGGKTGHTLTVMNGAGSGTYTEGTVVPISANAPPAGQVFVNWTGAAVQNSNAASTTLTMPASNTTVTANYTTAAVPIPYPVATHPRLWITQNDLPRLQGWANSTNPIYYNGIVPLLSQAVSENNQQFFPNGAPNPNYLDPGDVQGHGRYVTEQYAIIFALNSLIDPSPAARIQYAQYARNLLRDPLFAVYNRANGSGEQWPLIVDWIYNAKDGMGNPILTSADKLTIRNVFMIWANDCLSASTTGGDHPSPIGVTNSVQLLPQNRPYRMASNNYYLGHARLLTMMALCMDPADDPLVTSSLPASNTGNTLRSYILNANGAWLYQMYAMMGDPSAVAAAYGIPGNGAGLGLASGGLPPEGMLYGHSFGYILGQLLALQTAGFHDPTISGPQIGLIAAPVWDRYVTRFLSSLTPTAKVFPSQSWLGPVYQYGSYGDLLRLWATPDFMQPFALLTLLEQENGQSTHAAPARWFAVNGVEGGSAALLNRITQPWSWGTSNSILYFLLMDPAAPAAADITQATRSILWLNNDYIVVYDRAASMHAGLFKRFNLSLQNNPTINRNTTTETLISGQQLFIQTLLPQSPSISAAYAAGNLNPIAQLEPTQFILTVEDPNKPTTVRFLHVLQGANPGMAMIPASYYQSVSGTAFDGAVFGATAVYFPVNPGPIAVTSLFAPTGVHTLLVTGLNPNASCGVSIQATAGGTTISLTPGAAGSSADSAGVLRLTF